MAQNTWPGPRVQSLLFDGERWPIAKAKAWAKQHGYRASGAQLEDRFIHLRQHVPMKNRAKRMIRFGHGISAVIEQVK